ncbi:hypothetical protein [Hyalangium rubrum]|uniref:Uncharacterized protein n=1 Tax=Hyalangium rubrum TaxID=3103134 RepID=A0ABU5H0J7_9BACT|nr:hypothetical protein [Hyalangium sp. s54d21]MDY7226454.1 hypothetical protein [Hyalangium sp. s54d21]
MDFPLVNADMGGDLDNPTIALSIALAAIVFGLLMARVLRAPLPSARKGLLLGGLFALAFPGGRIAEYIAHIILVEQYSAPGVSIGFIGSVPMYTVPLCALLLAGLFHGIATLFTLMRKGSPSGAPKG